jgi:hypothetical protein
MQHSELITTFRNNFGKYTIWLLANLGGLLIPYLAAGMIWLLYQEFGKFLPGTDVFLIIGTVLLTSTMASYQKTKANDSANLWIGLYLVWPFLLMIVFGFFIAIGIKVPTMEEYILWILIISFLVLSVIWSSIVWLHEQGLLDDRFKPPSKPPTDPRLSKATISLPKIRKEE